MGMHQPVGNRLRRANLAGIAVLTVTFASVITGCGVQYRPVVSAIGPVGPASQPQKFAVAISSPSITSPGLATVVDFSGDTVLSTPQVQTNPSYFQLNTNGSQGFTINTQGSLDSIPLSSPTTLLTSNVTETTLPTDSSPVSITTLSFGTALSTIFIPEATTNSIAAINAGTAALYDTVGIQGGGSNPVYVVGAANAPRVYAISQNTNGGGSCGSNGQVDSLETISTTSISDSAQICVGVGPIYGVMTASDFRAFILNQGSGTVSVLNVISNALDTLPPGIVPAGTPVGTIPLPAIPVAGGGTVPPNPVWADLNTVDNEIVVLNQGMNGSPGSLSIINIPLCNASAQATNPNCSTTNPVDASNFGTILATVPVGIDPTMVSVLQGTDTNAPAAYVINQKDSTGTCTDTDSGTVTVVNLESGQVTATICGVSMSAATSAANGASNVIFGHPNSVSATGGAPTGKVYVTSSDSQYLSVIYTDTNTVQTHIPLQGNGLRVLVTAP
jgi:YVTN family beta-propeller protein